MEKFVDLRTHTTDTKMKQFKSVIYEHKSISRVRFKRIYLTLKVYLELEI